jgi:hypothetical protein
MFEGEFECANCEGIYPNNLETKVVTQTGGPTGTEFLSTVFCSGECSLEWERRGGQPRP